MTTPLIGVFVSGVGIIILTLLFRYERNSGSRMLAQSRITFDHLVERLELNMQVVSQYVSRDLIRQTFHFSLHTFLVSILHILKRSEQRLTAILRSNRSLATKARHERISRNKLDEIAEHKASVALSEEERQKRKEESLNG